MDEWVTVEEWGKKNNYKSDSNVENMGEIKIKSVEYGSKDYGEAIDIRYEILRKPLGLIFTQQQLLAERGQYHLVCKEGDRVLGCLVLMPRSDTQVQMRQVAILEDYRGRGLGGSLVWCSEEYAMELGYQEMIVHARESAVGFYEKLGYARVGECFIEVALPHWKLVKKLARTGRVANTKS